MKTVCEQELKKVIDSRLNMQSTIRSLSFYGLSGLNRYECLRTSKFREILANWPVMQQDLVFKLLAGIYWKQLKSEILY